MEPLPKLFPSWKDVAYQDLIRLKIYSQYASIKPPDFGGVGIDVNFDDDGLQCETVKNYKQQMDFAAQSCSLPFLPIKSKNISDFCTEPIIKEKENFKQFCIKLNATRYKCKKATPFNSKIKALQQTISEIHASKNYSEKNTLEIPFSLKYLTENMPKRAVIPKFNTDYMGGNLSVIHSDKQSLLHSCSEDLNNICVTPLQNGTDTHFEPLLSEQKTVLLKKEPILQIASSTSECCVVRTKSCFHLLNVDNLKLISKKAKGILYVAANPYNPVEVLSVYEQGKLKLRNMESKKTVWTANDYELPCVNVIYPTWRCDFGSHPFATLSMNEKSVYLFDLREDNRKELFCIKGPSFHVEEELTSMKLWNRNPFQHFLASTSHFIICDERYPKKSVMLWSHSLNDYPIYCDIADFQHSTTSVVVIGAQESRKTAAFFMDCSQTFVTPIGLGPPLELSSPSDCIDSLKLHAYHVSNELSTQFAYPLTGIGIEPVRQENAFTVFQVTSAGDVFHQDFRETFSDTHERTYHVTTGCTLTPPEKILPSVKGCFSSSPILNAIVDEKRTNIQIGDVYKSLDVPKEISANCSLCRFSAVDREIILTEICPRCILNAAQSLHMSKAVTNFSTVIGPVSSETSSLNPNIDYLSQFTDDYSKRILSVWIDTPNVDETITQEMSNSETTQMEIDHSNHRPTFTSFSDTPKDVLLQNENLSIHANSLVSMDTSFNDTIMDSEYSQIIPASQVRALIGETIFSSVKPKRFLNISKTSKAGF